jgi:hypothetical protein
VVSGGSVVAAVAVVAVPRAVVVALVTVVVVAAGGAMGVGAGVPDEGPRQTISSVSRAATSMPMMPRATVRPESGRCIDRTVVGRGRATMGL